MKDNNHLDLGKTNINKIFWTYLIPSILMMIVQSTAGFIDSIFIGRYVGPDGLAAITLVMPLIMLLVGVGIMIAAGGTTLAGIEKGAGNLRKSNNYFNVTASLLLIVSIIGIISLLLFIPSMARFTGATDHIFNYTVQYVNYISFFLPFFLLSFAFAFFLKLDGKPIVVVLIMVSGTLTNIVLDYICIVKLGMGIRGAALATGASQVIPVLFMTYLIIAKSTWTFEKPRFHLNEIGRIFFNGSSEFLSNIAVSITGVAFNYIIMKRIGGEGIAAYAVALQLAGIVNAMGYGVAEANQAAISYNFGAKQLTRVKKMRDLSLKVTFILGILLLFISVLFGKNLAGIFVKDQGTIALAVNILSYYSISFIFLGVNIGVGTYYTSINDPIRSAAITIYRSLIATLIGMTILPLLFGDNGIWLTVIFSEFTTFIFALIMIKHKPFGNHLALTS